MSGETWNFILGIAGALITALLIAVGAALWNITSEVRVLRQIVEDLKKEVDEVKSLVEQGREWRWDSGPRPAADRKT